MKYHSMTECWDFESSPKFLSTRVIFQNDEEFFSAELPDRVTHPETLTVAQQYLQRIPKQHIWPLLEENITICSDPERPDVYIKQPRLTGYNGTASLSLYMLQEARICEILLKNPHPNIARYLGCVIKDDRITGLCFLKYAETLESRLQSGLSFNSEAYCSQIQAGMNHLHALNLVHNDINSDNVMFVDQDDNALVIIDFDSCANEGDMLPDKRGQIPDSACTAEFENDEYSLRVLREELDQKCT